MLYCVCFTQVYLTAIVTGIKNMERAIASLTSDTSTVNTKLMQTFGDQQLQLDATQQAQITTTFQVGVHVYVVTHVYMMQTTVK